MKAYKLRGTPRKGILSIKKKVNKTQVNLKHKPKKESQRLKEDATILNSILKDKVI